MIGNCYMSVCNCYGSAYYAARSVWFTFLHLLQIGWQSTALKVLLYDGKSAVLLVFFFFIFMFIFIVLSTTGGCCCVFVRVTCLICSNSQS